MNRYPDFHQTSQKLFQRALKVLPGGNTRTTVFVGVGSWNVDDLMLVVEKDCRSIVFMDGSSHTMVGRIHVVEPGTAADGTPQ